MRFHTTVQLNGKTATGIPVPEEVVQGLGGAKRPAVVVTLNASYTYRSTVSNMNGSYMLPLSAEHRDGSGVEGGDEVDVELQLDTKPREITVPRQLADRLETEPEAKTFFDTLSYSKKQRLILPIHDAKTEPTRNRNIEKAMEKLRWGKL